MAAENLPWTYREQIVDFIVRNSGGGAALPPVPHNNVDPFTGGGAYVPSASRPTSSSWPAPAAPGPQSSAAGGSCDPFTGSDNTSSRLLYSPAAHALANGSSWQDPCHGFKTIWLILSERLHGHVSLACLSPAGDLCCLTVLAARSFG